MKADMEAMKEQMATMMEAMMSMKKIMEANAVAVADTSIVTKVNTMPPSGLNQMNHPTSARVGKDLGSTGGPIYAQIQNKHAFPPYGLPPNYTPPNVAYTPNENVNNSTPIPIESQQPRTIMHMSLKPWGRHMKFPTTIPPTPNLASDMPLKGKQLGIYPCRTLWRALSFAHNHNPCILRWEEPLLLWLERERWII